MNKAIKSLVIIILICVLVIQVIGIVKESKEMQLIGVYTLLYQKDKQDIINDFNELIDYISVTNLYFKRMLAMDDYMRRHYDNYEIEVSRTETLIMPFDNLNDDTLNTDNVNVQSYPKDSSLNKIGTP